MLMGYHMCCTLITFPWASSNKIFPELEPIAMNLSVVAIAVIIVLESGSAGPSLPFSTIDCEWNLLYLSIGPSKFRGIVFSNFSAFVYYSKIE